MRFMIMRKADRDTAADARVCFREGSPRVEIGPFAETRQLMSGFTLIDVGSMDEAVEWVKSHAPGDVNTEADLEIREVGCPGGLVGVNPQPMTGRPGRDPKFFVLLKANPQLEAGFAPDEATLAAMAKRNDEATRVGVMLAGEGLQPSSKGARVRFAGGKVTVVDGPFTEAKELIAGFWMIQVKSREEAIDWVKRYPYPLPDVVVEIRRIADGEIDA